METKGVGITGVLHRSTGFLILTGDTAWIALSNLQRSCRVQNSNKVHELELSCCSDSRKCCVSAFGRGKHGENTLFVPRDRRQTDD